MSAMMYFVLMVGFGSANPQNIQYKYISWMSYCEHKHIEIHNNGVYASNLVDTLFNL